MKLYKKLIAAAAVLLLCLLIRKPVPCCVILAVFAAALLAENVITELRLRRQLNSLIQYITRVQDDLSLAAPECAAEGLTGILQSEIYKVIALLREQYSGEKKQKEYMTDMLSDISHQIKTPLTAIQLMTELLEQPELDADTRMDYAEKIDLQISRITWLIRNLLALSRMEAGVLSMKPEPFPLPELIAEIVDSLAVMAELRGVALQTEIPALTLKADRHWFTEALMNIIKNCIEHTDDGGYVRIRAWQNNLFTELTVEDNGCGIKPADLPHIFERFYKAENASAQSVGIGLALAKQVIFAHGGTVEAESREGEGTCFTVRIYRMG